jgi:hypothetical protein
MQAFALDRQDRAARRARNFRLRLDTVVALQALGEESFCEGRTDATEILLDQENTILRTLRDAMETDDGLKEYLDGGLQEMRTQVRFYEAHYSFLIGRLTIRKKGVSDPDALNIMRTNFNLARGVNSELNCRIDLEMGCRLLQGALEAKSNNKAVYDEAVAALERAASHDAPALRTETIDALREAYTMRNAVLIKAKDSSRSS